MGLKWRLGFVFAGASLLVLSALLRWLRPDQPDIANIAAMTGAVLSTLPVLCDAIASLVSRTPDDSGYHANQFIALAVLACFASGLYVTAGIVAVILVLGHLLENRSMLGTNAAIQSLLTLSRTRARRLRDGTEELVDTDSLRPGDTVRVLPGETVPADGRVLSGWSTVNQATITGEALPVEISEGAHVFAGTSNLTGPLEIEVTKTGAETVLGRASDIVQEARQTRAPIVRLTEQYARHYTPLILLIAGFVLFFTRDVERAISVIVVSIPCAFVLAGPSAMVAALASALRLGILVKSVRFLEAANEIDTLVFDKTGTLTTGELQVVELRPQNGWQEEDLLAIAAAIERHSTHPFARSVLATAHERGVEVGDSTDVQEQHGKGVSGIVAGRKVLVGRASWLSENSINLGAPDQYDERFSILFLAVDGEFAGSILLGDSVREEARDLGTALCEQGVDRLLMLTGDRRAVAESIAAGIGFSEFQAECLPEQKLAVVRRLKEEGRKVMVVGDGVNDAPALAEGDLSVAMGALGSDVAIQTADVALMASDLSRLPHFLALSNQTLRIINQNLFYGFVFIIATIVLSSFGAVTPIVAALLHEFGAFFVIFNSARLLRFDGR